jgi:paxillin
MELKILKVDSSLDNMMINLQENMDKQGVRTTQKGVCNICQKPIVGQVITALGTTLIEKILLQFTRRKKNSTHLPYSLKIIFVVLFYINKNMNQLKTYIKSILGQTFHPEHFVCHHCNQELGTRNFFERDGFAYCEADYHLLFSPR